MSCLTDSTGIRHYGPASQRHQRPRPSRRIRELIVTVAPMANPRTSRSLPIVPRRPTRRLTRAPCVAAVA